MTTPIPLIYDCDNTMGIFGKDVDDGLALLYLLGCDDIDLQAITLTYGNGNINTVIQATKKLVERFNISVPVYSKQEAVEFLASSYDVNVLATGSLANLYEAAQLQKDFYHNINELFIMGGIVEPLWVRGVEVSELNFSCNPLAAKHVLDNAPSLHILNAHTTSQALFGTKEITRLQQSSGAVYTYIYNAIRHWVTLMNMQFKMDGFCNWDMAAAIYITHRELFSIATAHIQPTMQSLQQGNINVSSSGKEIVMPDSITDLDTFNTLIFEAWDNFQSHISTH